MGSQISVVTSNDATAVASAIFNGPGVSITDATFLNSYYEENGLGGNLGSAGIFTSGPFGIGSGGILTTGYSRDADESSYGQNVDTQVDGSSYCGPDTTNAAVLSVDIVVEPEYNGLSVEFILATVEEFVNPDPIGIYLDGIQHAVDTLGNRITVKSEYLTAPIGITEPNHPSRSTAYDRSSPPLIMGLSASPGVHTMIFAICDANNGLLDSGLMVKAGGCVGCNSDIKINYATTTTTVGPTSFVSTIQASGTMSGTVVYGEPEEATTTTEEITTSTDVTATASEMTTSSEDTTIVAVTQSAEASSSTELSSTTDLDPTSTGTSESISWSESSTQILETITSEVSGSATDTTTSFVPYTTTVSTQGGLTTIRRGCRP
ncbi:hypothetical protein IL306_009152 [Fusarium sp. DS 682]|nr:hypothetical protein IL306_009152 [Fusarium sp. DS 682]